MVVVATSHQTINRGHDYLVNHRLAVRSTQLGQRTVRAHAAGIRSLITIIGPLVVLGHRQDPVVTIAQQDKHRVFRTNQAFFQHQPGLAAGKHLLDRLNSRGVVLGDHNPFATR